MKTKITVLSIVTLLTAVAATAQDNRIWATYYGSTGGDGNTAVATDADGNVFLAGITQSPTGMASGGFQNTFGGGNTDAFLAKFDSTGIRLWATYYGGADDEMNFFGGKIGIAADGTGNIYLAGLTKSTTGIASGGFQNTMTGTVSAYLVKFNGSGNRLWATYYNGTSIEKAQSVAADVSGNVYLAGVAGSTSGIASGGFQNTIGGGSDAFLVKFDAAGNRLWATYYGGAGTDEGFCVVTDNSSNIYLAGTTASTSAIASGGFQNTYGGGGSDIFLAKFNSAGARTWATYFGGSGDEMVLFAGDVGVATDNSGNIFLTGLTNSTAGIASGGFQNTFGGGSDDAFLAKINSSGALLWSTYYGGTDADKGYDVATNTAGDSYIVGRTLSSNAISSGGFQNSSGGNGDAFLAKFDAGGNRLCATYFGSTDVDDCNGVATDAFGNIYLSGASASTSGIAYNGFQNFHGGGVSDAMLVKFTSSCFSTQVDEIYPDENLSAYPNPSADVITFCGKNIKEIILYDTTGKKIFSKNLCDDATTINISALASGFYLARVTTDYKTENLKVVKY